MTCFDALHDAFPGVLAFWQVADSSTKEALRWLCQKTRGFITWSNELKQYSATEFGKATMASSLSPEQALLVKKVLI